MYDGLLSESTYAYRPGRAALQAIGYLDKEISSGTYNWCLKADIRGFFDHIILKKLYQILAERIREADAMELIRRCLEAPSLEKDGKLTAKTMGIYQGSGIAPVLSNIYMMKFDQDVRQHCKVYVRYSDDILILGTSCEELEAIRKFISLYLEKLGLQLNETKTKIVSLDEDIEFLGYALGKNGKQIPAKAENNLDQSLEAVFLNRKLTLEEQLKKGSEILNGWEQYYKQEREIGSIQEYAVVVYMMQNHADGKLDFLKDTRKRFENVYRSIAMYLVKFWKSKNAWEFVLLEYEQLFGMTGLDTGLTISDTAIQDMVAAFDKLTVQEQVDVWTELMQQYSDVGAYNRAAFVMKRIENIKTQKTAVYESIPQSDTMQQEASSIPANRLTSDWLAAFSGLFVGREDIYGEEQLVKGSKRQVVSKLEPLTDDVLKTHFSGKKTIATYIQRTNQTVKYMIIDVDISKRILLGGSEQEQINRYLPKAAAKTAQVLKLLEQMGVRGYAEQSGYRGFHVWIFLPNGCRYVML